MTLTTDAAASPPSPVDGDLFRTLLRHQANTVTVVTAPGRSARGVHRHLVPLGVAEPAAGVVLPGPFLVELADVAHVGHVGVHLLAHPQQGLARTFATSGIDRFASPTVWRAGPHGVPILAGTLAWLICRVVDWVMVGDRALLVAEPLLGQQGDEGSPLLYHAGRYAGLAAPADPASRSRDAA
jgi:hypothetical protein